MMAAEELGDCLVDEDDEEALEAALKAEEASMIVVVMVFCGGRVLRVLLVVCKSGG